MELVAPPSEIFAGGLLSAHVAIVTGGGTNLGEAAAAEFARCGADVVIAGRREDVLQDAAADIGPRCTWVRGDIREAGDCARIVDVTIERHGRVDTLLISAGGQDFAAAEVVTPTGWAAVQRLNIDGTLLMTRSCVERALRPGGGGMIASVTVSPPPGLPGDGPQRRGAGARGGRGDDARLGRALGGGRDQRGGARARALRHGLAAQVRGRADRGRRPLRTTGTARRAARVRLARGARGIAARALAERQHDHARRRRRRLVGPVAAGRDGRRGGTVPTEERCGS